MERARTGLQGVHVADDNGVLVFAKVKAQIGCEYPAEDATREEFEKVHICWMFEHPEDEHTFIRCDEFDFAVVSDHRAALRHHVSCING